MLYAPLRVTELFDVNAGSWSTDSKAAFPKTMELTTAISFHEQNRLLLFGGIETSNNNVINEKVYEYQEGNGWVDIKHDIPSNCYVFNAIFKYTLY